MTGGGRYDVTFTMRERPVALGLDGDSKPGILFGYDGDTAKSRKSNPAPRFDPSEYDAPEPTLFGAESDFDREFDVVLDNRPGFYDGLFYMLWTINGECFQTRRADGP